MRVPSAHALGVAIVLAPAIGSPDVVLARTQLRSVQTVGQRLLDDGLARSPTIRRLVDRLEASDVIVYVDVRRDMAPHMAGTTYFVARTATHRILRITLNRAYKWPALIAFLGHELQHACEVADAPDIDSVHAMKAYYREFGVRIDQNAYDTREARDVGRLVEREIRGRTSDIARLPLKQPGMG